jgi:hypothetical protein
VSFVLLQSVIALLIADGRIEEAGQFRIDMGTQVKAGKYPRDLERIN